MDRLIVGCVWLSLSLSAWLGDRSCRAKSITPLQYQSAAKGFLEGPVTGAAQFDRYLPYLRDKRVGMVVNSNSLVDGKHIVDTLLAQGIQVVRIFSPERNIGVSGPPQVLLYGTHDMPTAEDLADIDIVVFDVQDIGVRFYVYLYTLHYVMEACAMNRLDLLVLDRPNPMGATVDGPLMDLGLRHPLGMHPIPVLHGMTMAEYARMVNGECWLTAGVQCPLILVDMRGYRRAVPFKLAIPPFPNLNSQRALLLYPSLCLFDGTVISQGRGTQAPFTVLGHPGFKGRYAFSFTPAAIPTMSARPLYEGQTCYGLDLGTGPIQQLMEGGQLNLSWLLELYRHFPEKDDFFNDDKFDRLAGTAELRQQIQAGSNEETIRLSWETALTAFKAKRKKYLLYEAD